MTDTVKDMKLFDIEFNGEYLFVYSDKYNIFFFFLDRGENKLYKITTDKYFIVEYIDEISTPKDFTSFKDIKFFKPFNINNTEYSFIGIVIFDDKTYKFKIEDSNELIYTEETRYSPKEGIINTISCLASIDIFSYIQKKNRIFIIGYDEKYQDYIYGIVSIEDNKFEKIYSITSDYGDIIPMSINTDTEEGKVYIVGKHLYYDENDKLLMSKPYFDMFLLN